MKVSDKGLIELVCHEGIVTNASPIGPGKRS